jgi:hypothetical protein
MNRRRNFPRLTPHLLGLRDSYLRNRAVSGEGGGNGGSTPALLLNLRETSGTTPANDGDLDGLTITWTPGAGAVGQLGVDGPGEAYLFDGAGSFITITNDEAAADLFETATQRWAFLIRLSSDGALFTYGQSFITNLIIDSNHAVDSIFVTSGTNALAETDVDAVADLVDTFAWIFMDYDDADTLGNGRRIRLWKALVGGVVEALSLVTDTAATGTYTPSANDMRIGDSPSLVGSEFDGLMDRVSCEPGELWTTEAMQALVDAHPLAALALTDSAGFGLTDSAGNVLGVRL